MDSALPHSAICNKREAPLSALSAVSILHAGVQRKCRQEARNRFNYVQRHHTPDQSAAITGIWGHGTNTATSRPRNLSQENILLYIQSREIQIYSFFYWQFWKCIICVLYTSHKNINQLWLEKNIIIPRLETINISYFVHPAFA